MAANGDGGDKMLKVLAVDDERPTHEALRCMLCWKDLGFQAPDSAFDGAEALEMMRQKQYDVVITDIRMPGMDGVSFMRSLRCINNRVQILVVTGYDLFSYAQEAIRCGAKDFFLKPLDRRELEARLRQIADEIRRGQGLSAHEAPEKSQGDNMERVVAYLDNCFRQEISVRELAGIFYMNPAYLGQRFRKATGQTIDEYINRKRIAWVKEMVRQENLYSQEAIRMAGYRNCGYFYRKFQEIEGVSFAQWRQSVKLGETEAE